MSTTTVNRTSKSTASEIQVKADGDKRRLSTMERKTLRMMEVMEKYPVTGM